MECGGVPPLHLPLSREGLLSLFLLRRFLPTASHLHYQTPLGRVTVPTLLTPAGLTMFVISHPAALHTATLGHTATLHTVSQERCQVHHPAVATDPLARELVAALGETVGRLQVQVDQMKVHILQLHLDAVVARGSLQESEDRVKLLRSTIKLLEAGGQEEGEEKVAENPVAKNEEEEGSARCSTVNDENNNVKEKETTIEAKEKDAGTTQQTLSGPEKIEEHKQGKKEQKEKEHCDEQEKKVSQDNKENKQVQGKNERPIKGEVQDGILTIRPKLKRI